MLRPSSPTWWWRSTPPTRTACRSLWPPQLMGQLRQFHGAGSVQADVPDCSRLIFSPRASAHAVFSSHHHRGFETMGQRIGGILYLTVDAQQYAVRGSFNRDAFQCEARKASPDKPRSTVYTETPVVPFIKGRHHDGPGPVADGAAGDHGPPPSTVAPRKRLDLRAGQRLVGAAVRDRHCRWQGLCRIPGPDLR